MRHVDYENYNILLKSVVQISLTSSHVQMNLLEGNNSAFPPKDNILMMRGCYPDDIGIHSCTENQHPISSVPRNGIQTFPKQKL